MDTHSIKSFHEYKRPPKIHTIYNDISFEEFCMTLTPLNDISPVKLIRKSIPKKSSMKRVIKFDSNHINCIQNMLSSSISIQLSEETNLPTKRPKRKFVLGVGLHQESLPNNNDY